MLLVKTYLDRSAIAGIGLFAGEPIAKDTLLWKLSDVDLVIHQRDLDAQGLSELQRQFFESHAYKNGNTYYLCIDDARFMNHSYEANTYDKGQATFAARDIAAGEEITSNYGNYDDSKRHLDYCRPRDQVS